MVMILPDSESLARDALEHHLVRDFKRTDTSVRVIMPNDWIKLFPLVTIRKSSGTARNARYLDSGVFTVHCFAGSRKEASLLSRQVRRALADACLERYSDGEGALTYFKEITGPLYSSGDTQLNHPDVHRFVASYILYSHPASG
ncbi:hypothetical protein ACFY0N_30775 [Streptomyces vinaceus]|uniref:hypothetical protein n=1 Tax=Streptomyces vinaceus TaxID=1960 RepID=UPI00369AE4F6